MQSLEEKKHHFSVIVKTCYITAIVYICFRLLYLIYFLIAQAWILVYIDIASIIIYGLCFLVIKLKKYKLYTLICGNEFLISMSAFTILGGFETGFHLCIIGLCIVSFFTVYFSTIKRNINNAITWTILSFLVYIGIYYYSSSHANYYNLDHWIVVSLFTINAIAAFAFIAAYMIIFTRYAMGLENRIINESRIDRLTQISNRNDMYNYLDSIEDKNGYALAIFDIDDFKKINDFHGHVFGDFILKEVARIATDTLKDYFVCRYGGEEFIVIAKIDDMNNVFNSLDKYRLAIEKNKFEFNNMSAHLTITTGLTEYKDDISIEKWIDLADEKLYKGKNSGKNQIVM